MKKNDMNKIAKKTGIYCSPCVTIAVARDEQSGRWLGSISIGEEYYETDPYKDKECAIAELRGWWNGTKIKVEQYLKSVENENAL